MAPTLCTFYIIGHAKVKEIPLFFVRGQFRVVFEQDTGWKPVRRTAKMAVPQGSPPITFFGEPFALLKTL